MTKPTVHQKVLAVIFPLKSATMRIQIIGHRGSIVLTPDLAINQVSIEKERGLDRSYIMYRISIMSNVIRQNTPWKSNSCLMFLRGRGVKYQPNSNQKQNIDSITKSAKEAW